MKIPHTHKREIYLPFFSQQESNKKRIKNMQTLRQINSYVKTIQEPRVCLTNCGSVSLIITRHRAVYWVESMRTWKYEILSGFELTF